MNLDLDGLCRHIHFASTSALPLCLLLSACGGDGTSHVASIPPPTPAPTPTPTPTGLPAGTTTYNYPSSNSIDIQKTWSNSPATRLGTYDVIGRLTLTRGNGTPSSTREAAPGEFTMKTYSIVPVQSRFMLNAPAGILPQPTTSLDADFESSWDINAAVAYHYNNSYGDSATQDLGERLTAFDKATGKQLFSYDFTRGVGGTMPLLGAATQLQTLLDYDIGYSYVAMGEWSWRVVDLTGKAMPGTESGSLLFVDGDRTPSTGIPATGSATYDARTLLLLSNGSQGIPFALTADFGARSISTRIDQDYLYTTEVDAPTLGIHVGGSAPFSSNGLFDIPLAGTANYSSTNPPGTPPSEPVTGAMNGAFFGPNAEQVGGTFSLQNSGGTLLMQDAFVGQQHR